MQREETLPLLATAALLVRLHESMRDEEGAARWRSMLERARAVLPAEVLRMLDSQPDDIRAAAVQEARKRLSKSGRDALDPPPDTRGDEGD